MRNINPPSPFRGDILTPLSLSWPSGRGGRGGAGGGDGCVWDRKALASYSVDWKRWAERALFDEFVPQLYRASFADFAPLLNATLTALAAGGVPLAHEHIAIGLRADGSGTPTPWGALDEMLTDVERTHGLSPSVWYSQAAIELYPTELTAFFDGGAVRSPPPPPPHVPPNE